MYLRSMLRIFFSNQSYALLGAPLLVAFYGILNFFTRTYLPEAGDQIDLGLWGVHHFDQSITGMILAPLMVGFSGVLINLMFNRNAFFDRNTFLPVLLYCTASAYFPHFYFLNGFGIAQFLIVLSMFNLFRLNQNEDARKVMFNASLFWSLASTFFPPLLLVIPFLYGVMWIFRPFIFKESAALSMGALVPYIYLVAYYVLTKQNYMEVSWTTSSRSVGQVTVIALSSGSLLFVSLSLRTVLKNLTQGSIRLRKILSMSMWLTLAFIAIIALDFFMFKHTGSAALLLPPLMFMIPYGFGQKKLRQETAVLYYIFFLASVSNFFLSYFL